jgi:hypothetical protein
VITIAPAPPDLDEEKQARWRAVADLYHAYFTGLILAVVTRRGAADAAEFVFRVFRRQHGDLRHSERGVGRHAARLARQ